MVVRQISGGAARLIQSRCGGRQLPDPVHEQRRPPGRCSWLAAGVSRRAQQDCMCALQRRAAQKATDTLSVAWLRGGFGRGAGASPAGFLYHMDWLEDVYSKVGPSGVSPPVHERSRGNAHAHRLRIAWQVLGSLKRASHESIPSIHQLRE